MMCMECADCFRVFSNFTTGRAYTEDEETLPLSDLDNDVELDPEAIETTSNPKLLMGTQIKCCFCTKTRGREDLISLQISKENKFAVDMLEQYMSETNLIKDTEELLTCETCLGALEGVLSVILKCVEVEEKISKYIELEGTDDNGQIKLKGVQQFMFKPVLKSESEPFSVNELEDKSDQLQDEYTALAEPEIKYEREIRNAELIIKTEENDIRSEQNDCDIADTKSKESNSDRCQDPEINMFQCEFCPYQTKRKSALTRHLLIHKNPPEIEMLKCEICSYEAKQKYQLKLHLLTHKNSTEIKMFKCELCSYEAKQKRSLKIHLLSHKSPSEIKMFKCELCPYKSILKCNLKTHLLIHRNPLEIQMYKCDMCPYKAKYKLSLQRHLLTHKSTSELKMFKCRLCCYETKWKDNLRTHLWTHGSPSEIKIFKCELCSYKARMKCRLNRHLLTHKKKSFRNKEQM